MAGTTLAKLLLRLGADSREFRSALTRGEKRMKKFARASREFSKALTIGITAPSILAGGKIIQMGIDAVEGRNLVEESFEGMTGAAIAWSEKLSKALGLNKFELQENAAMMHTMLQSMGLSEDQAYKMSTSLVELSGDLESLYNLPHGDAWEKLRSGISGEAEPLKRIGILVNENTIKQVAYQNGIAETGKALTETQKVQARYLAIIQATSKAQGNLARTLKDPKNQLRAMRNEAIEVATELGMSLMPIVKDLIPVAKDAAAAVRVWAEAFQRLTPENRKLVLEIVAMLALAGPVTRMFSTISGLGASLAHSLRGASFAAHKLSNTQKVAAATSQQWVSANVKASRSLNNLRTNTLAFNASAVTLAATLGYQVGSVLRPWIEEVTGLDEATFKVASKQKEWVDQLANDQDAWNQAISNYDKMRKKLGLLGEEWEVGRDHTRANAAVLTELIPKLNEHIKANLRQAAAQREANTATMSAEEISKRIKNALASQDGAIDNVTKSTREMYGVISKKEAENQMKKLVTDFQLLAKDGVSADQLMEAFGPKVEALAKAAGGYSNLNMPQEFTQLKYALGAGKGMLASFAQTMATQIPDGATKAKAALEGSIGSAMTNAKGEVEKGAEEIHGILTKMAEHTYEVEVKPKLDVDDLQRQMAEAGMQPNGPGVTP